MWREEEWTNLRRKQTHYEGVRRRRIDQLDRKRERERRRRAWVGWGDKKLWCSSKRNRERKVLDEGEHGGKEEKELRKESRALPSVRRAQEGGSASTDGDNECFSTRKGESLFFTFPYHFILLVALFFLRSTIVRMWDTSTDSSFGSLAQPRATFLEHQFIRG